MCAYIHIDGFMNLCIRASLLIVATKLERKQLRKGEGKRIAVIKPALFYTDRWLPAIVFQHLKMKHIHLAFRTNGFNKGRVERWGNTDD